MRSIRVMTWCANGLKLGWKWGNGRCLIKGRLRTESGGVLEFYYVGTLAT